MCENFQEFIDNRVDITIRQVVYPKLKQNAFSKNEDGTFKVDMFLKNVFEGAFSPMAFKIKLNIELDEYIIRVEDESSSHFKDNFIALDKTILTLQEAYDNSKSLDLEFYYNLKNSFRKYSDIDKVKMEIIQREEVKDID